jgi:hypothetical protein
MPCRTLSVRVTPILHLHAMKHVARASHEGHPSATKKEVSAPLDPEPTLHRRWRRLLIAQWESKHCCCGRVSNQWMGLTVGQKMSFCSSAHMNEHAGKISSGTYWVQSSRKVLEIMDRTKSGKHEKLRNGRKAGKTIPLPSTSTTNQKILLSNRCPVCDIISRDILLQKQILSSR